MTSGHTIPSFHVPGGQKRPGGQGLRAPRAVGHENPAGQTLNGKPRFSGPCGQYSPRNDHSPLQHSPPEYGMRRPLAPPARAATSRRMLDRPYEWSGASGRACKVWFERARTRRAHTGDQVSSILYRTRTVQYMICTPPNARKNHRLRTLSVLGALTPCYRHLRDLRDLTFSLAKDAAVTKLSHPSVSAASSVESAGRRRRGGAVAPPAWHGAGPDTADAERGHGKPRHADTRAHILRRLHGDGASAQCQILPSLLHAVPCPQASAPLPKVWPLRVRCVLNA